MGVQCQDEDSVFPTEWELPCGNCIVLVRTESWLCSQPVVVGTTSVFVSIINYCHLMRPSLHLNVTINMIDVFSHGYLLRSNTPSQSKTHKKSGWEGEVLAGQKRARACLGYHPAGLSWQLSVLRRVQYPEQLHCQEYDSFQIITSKKQHCWLGEKIVCEYR